MLVKLVHHLGLEDHDKILVGFLQGGLLAPRLALELKNVRRIIGIGTNFRLKVQKSRGFRSTRFTAIKIRF